MRCQSCDDDARAYKFCPNCGAAQAAGTSGWRKDIRFAVPVLVGAGLGAMIAEPIPLIDWGTGAAVGAAMVLLRRFT